MFIVLEGMDGSGKSTQVPLVAERLRQQYPQKEVVESVSPTEDFVGKCIRDVFTLKVTDKLPGWRTMMHLFMADMEMHGVRIRRWQKDGKIILVDRYWFSSFVYQSVSAGLDEGPKSERFAERQIVKLAESLPMPQLTIVLSISEEVSKARSKDADAYEENEQFRLRVKRKYAEMRSTLTTIEHIATSKLSIEETTNRIVGLVEKRWPRA